MEMVGFVILGFLSAIWAFYTDYLAETTRYYYSEDHEKHRTKAKCWWSFTLGLMIPSVGYLLLIYSKG